MVKTFEINELLRVARRENNTKRSFLYVCPYQGKHMPVSPLQSLELFAGLAERVRMRYPDEKILVIGFAETATAIGSSVAFFNDSVTAFMTTTRENVDGAEYLYFTESHSHAAEQRLTVNGLEQYLRVADRIVFAEDEVTTGNTIEKLIRVLKETFPEIPMQFGIASVLNSMTDARMQEFAERGIFCTYIAHIPFAYRTDEIRNYKYEPPESEPEKPSAVRIDRIRLSSSWNPRLITGMEQIHEQCSSFIQNASEALDGLPERLLVLGTEECMFPGILLGAALEQKGHSVRFHATTRSPIDVSLHEQYPLHRRFPLHSFYEPERRTFIYNLKAYDAVIVVTDAADCISAGLESLAGALEACGNTHMILLQWSGKE